MCAYAGTAVQKNNFAKKEFAAKICLKILNTVDKARRDEVPFYNRF
jgi:hypothetical protein